MAEDKLKVLIVEPARFPKVEEIGAELKDMQAIVGGDIEVVCPFKDRDAIICNEEGKINGMPLNRVLRDESNVPYDILAGTFFVVGLTEDDFCSLTDDQIEEFSALFHSPEEIYLKNGNIVTNPLSDDYVEFLVNADKEKAEREQREKDNGLSSITVDL